MTHTDDLRERVARAIHDVDRKSFPDVVRHIPARTVYHERARAALTAAGPDPDWLDAALDSVECKRHMSLDGYTDETGATRWRTYLSTMHFAMGDTPSTSIRNAIAKALAAKQEGITDATD